MLFQGKSSSRAKSRAQFTPMRTTAADSRTKIVITLDTLCRPNPLFDKQTVDGKPLTKPYGHGEFLQGRVSQFEHIGRGRVGMSAEKDSRRKTILFIHFTRKCHIIGNAKKTSATPGLFRAIYEL
jgi:hypothetical protein